MSGYYNQSDPYDDEERQGSGGGGLRKQLEEALDRAKGLEKQLNELRQGSVTDLLKDKGIDPAVAGLIPKDQDPKEWLEKNEHLLAKTTGRPELLEETKAAEPTISAPAEEDEAVVAEREARKAMEAAASDGTPPHISNDLLERMDKITSEEELLAFFGENGMTGSQ